LSVEGAVYASTSSRVRRCGSAVMFEASQRTPADEMAGGS
jgi:hypothetical protein